MTNSTPVAAKSAALFLAVGLLFAFPPLLADTAAPAAAPAAAAPSPSLAPEFHPGFYDLGEPEIRAWLEFLASAEVEGRGTGQRGYAVAARYIASMLQSWGIEPGAADGTYLQKFELVQRRGLQKARLKIVSASGEAEEIDPLSVGTRGIGSIEWRRPWVFAGFGEGASDDAIDDFSGFDLAESVVLIVPRAERTRDEHVEAIRRGATRLVIVSDTRAERGRGLRTGLQSIELALERDGIPHGVRVVYIARAVADRILARAGRDLSAMLANGRRPEAIPLSGLEIELDVGVDERRLESSNVVGVLRGSDAARRDEYVGVGAHLDHMGRRNDQIFYGADDDASGVSAVLAVARALTQNERRPRRSFVFMFFGAEELGLHGSRYFADHPPFPIERMVVEIQLDMVGRNEELKDEKAEDNESTIHVVGSRRHSLELDPWVQRLAGAVGLELEYDMESVYRRSDHYNFARLGVPVAFFFAGFHPDYHKVTDTPDKINYGKILRVSRLVYQLGVEIADRERRLVNNRL